MVLLDVMLKAGMKPKVAHANFQLRDGESDDDEKFVEAYCKKNKLSFVARRFFTQSFASESKQSIQMAARELRYAWLRELMLHEGAKAVITAHHASDQAETVLLNLMRGTGIKGFQGMRVLREGIFRPLLKADQEEIIRHAGNFRVAYREDSSNESTKYKRNFIRHEILKTWEATYPGTLHQVLRSSDLMSEWNDYVDEKMVTDLAEFWEKKDFPQRMKLDIVKHRFARLLIRSWLMPYEMADQASFILEASERPGAVFSGPAHELLVDRDVLILREKGKQPLEERWMEPMQMIEFGSWHFHWKREEEVHPKTMDVMELRLDPERMQWPLLIRQMKTGDKMQPFGMKGKKLLSDLFTDAKIDRFEKENWPVLCMGEEIIWVPGLRSSERLRMDDAKKGPLLVLVVSRG